MKPTPEILTELKDISPLLAGMDRINPFTVPEGYFESLPMIILAGLEEANPSFIYSIPKPSGQPVPEGYFDGLAGSIMAKIKALEPSAAEEIRSLSPMLYSIQGENVFTVPRGYFESLAEEITHKVKPIVPAKLVTMRKRSNSFIKYAIAAAFTGVMAMGVFKFSDNSKETALGTGSSTAAIAQVSKVDAEIAKLSNADILKYLENNGDNIDMAAVTGLIDEKGLPEQSDYMLDDKTLDKAFENLNVEDLKN